MACEVTYVGSQRDLALQVELAGDLQPTSDDGLAGLKQLASCRIIERASLHQFFGDGGHPFADSTGGAPLLRAVDRVASLPFVPAACNADIAPLRLQGRWIRPALPSAWR